MFFFFFYASVSKIQTINPKKKKTVFPKRSRKRKGKKQNDVSYWATGIVTWTRGCIMDPWMHNGLGRHQIIVFFYEKIKLQTKIYTTTLLNMTSGSGQ